MSEAVSVMALGRVRGGSASLPPLRPCDKDGDPPSSHGAEPHRRSPVPPTESAWQRLMCDASVRRLGQALHIRLLQGKCIGPDIYPAVVRNRLTQARSSQNADPSDIA